MGDNLIPTASAALYALVLASCVPEHARRRSRKNGVYLPGFFFWVGAVCGGLFSVLGWLGSGSGTFTVVVFASGVMIASLLMLGWRNCFLVYDREGITQQNLICMQRRFRYEHVTGWCTHPGGAAGASVYALGKEVAFSLLSPESAGFLIALNEGYRRTHGGQKLPVQWQKRHTTGFRAHVRNSGEFLFIFLLLTAFLLGGGVYCAWVAWTPLDGSDCETLSLTFESWSVEDNDLRLTAKGYDEAFEIRGYPEFVSVPEGITEHCDGETVFTAQARPIDADGGDDYYWIQSLRAEGIDYLTLADATAQQRTNLSPILWLFGGFLAVILGFAGLTYLVGRDPEKYPKWLVKSLFRDGYIVY